MVIEQKVLLTVLFLLSVPMQLKYVLSNTIAAYMHTRKTTIKTVFNKGYFQLTFHPVFTPVHTH